MTTEMYSAGMNNLTHQPLSFTIFEVNGCIHIEIGNTKFMVGEEKEKKSLSIKDVQSNEIPNRYEYIDNDDVIQIHHTLKPRGRMSP